MSQFKNHIQRSSGNSSFSAEHWQSLTERLAEMSAGINYGEVEAVLRIHNKRIVSVTYSVKEQTRQEITQL